MRSFPLIFIMMVLGLSIWWGAVERGAYAQMSLILALSLVWAALTAEATERGLVHRRLWVTYAINPTSSLHGLLWGGVFYMGLRALLVAPLTLLLFCQLLSQGWFEWSAIITVAGLAIVLRSFTFHKIKSVCSPIYSEYLSRRASVITAACILTPLLILMTLLSPLGDLRDVSFREAISVSASSELGLPSPFDVITRVSMSFDQAYAWSIQVAVDELSMLNRWLRWFLLGVFVLHKSLVAFAAARLISGVITLGEFEQVQTKLNLIRASTQPNMHPQDDSERS